MMIKNLMAGAAAIGLAVAPVAANANTRAGASLPTVKASTIKLGERAGVSVDKRKKLGGEGSGLLIALLAGAAVIAGIVIAVDGDDDDDDDRSDGV